MAELFLDRIEDEIAVLIYEDRELKLPRALLPAGAREGDVLSLHLTVDANATARAKQQAEKLRGKLGEGDDGGDVKL